MTEAVVQVERLLTSQFAPARPSRSDLVLPVPENLGEKGWPWTAASTTYITGSLGSWPRISIITPSYNQAAFLESTIRSVLLQGYPDLEYIVIDGGSTDGSVDIIRKYERWLAYWISERDHGQSEAINKGFRRATGDIVAWLNSDDTYQPGAIHAAVAALKASRAGAVYSRCRMVDPSGNLLQMYEPEVPLTIPGLIMLWRHPFASPPQPTVFFRRAVLDRAGLLDETLHYALDYEYWLRALQYFEFEYVDEVWANYTIHPKSKTGQGWQQFSKESFRSGRRYLNRLGRVDRWIYRIAGPRLLASRRELDASYEARQSQIWSDMRRHLARAVCLNPTLAIRPGVLRLGVEGCARLFRSNR